MDKGHHKLKQAGIATVAQLDEFDEIIDVRSPSEFAEDHIPGARNCPVLNDEERARVGTTYKQVSAFEAKKIGAALVSRNIAHHLEQEFVDKPRNWRPLIYCWRGGSRSGSMVEVFNRIGWRAERLDGGYKAYRRTVLEELKTLPGSLEYRVVCGLTGSGKSRLLQALKRAGAPVLDLEQLAAHRGSVLGNLPDEPQPTQKQFESDIWWALRHFSPGTPVFVEAESKKIGNVRVPDALIATMWQSPCIRLDVDSRLRVALLKEEYVHFLEDPKVLHQKLDFLVGIYGHETIARWKEMSERHEWDFFVHEILERHYDPAYTRSMRKHYPHYDECLALTTTKIGDAAMDQLARQALSANDPAGETHSSTEA
jgi:tRNA 2-selenouridine synthase